MKKEKKDNDMAVSRTLSEVRRKAVECQMYCTNCFEILYQEKNHMEVDRQGIPFLIHLEEIFKRKVFKKHICHECGSENINYRIAYCPDYIEPDPDLPF